MLRLKPATRIAITLGFISATIIWIAHGLDLFPSPNAHVQQKRLAVVRTLAGSISGIASDQKASRSALQRSLELTNRLNEDVRSLGVRGKSGYLVKTSGHQANWADAVSEEKANRAEVQVFANKRLWGTLEVCFTSVETGLLGFMFPLSTVVFVSLLTTGFSWWVLSRSFRYLNPSKVVPKRVKSAFDTLTEGLVLIDQKHEIAHANQAFTEILGGQTDADSLVGTSLNELGWANQAENGASQELPWFQCIENKASVTGRILEIGEGENRRKFFVNSAPIFGNESECRGAMISFDDVTEMERQKIELAALVKTLRSSRDEVELQNQKLTFLANYDPLTECMNRRAFWDEFEKVWADAEPDELSLLMIDVDHFKSFNDTYGHTFGDLVLKGLGDTLRTTVTDRGLISRFGGEEFVVAIPNMKLEQALELTNAIHKAIGEMDVEGKSVTASIGFSSREFKAMDGQHMLDQADIALYAAKRSGRDRVMRFDKCDLGGDLSLDKEGTGNGQMVGDAEIPKATVEGFLRAIGFRCEATADHSRRVARLCVSVGKTFLKSEEIHRLEVAAQLHEIGKLGMPDAIVNRVRELSTDQWQIVDRQHNIGVQLVQSVCDGNAIPQIIEAVQRSQDSQNANQNDLGGESNGGTEALEASVAILRVCDEFDSLVHGSDTRQSLKVEDAIKVIKEGAPERFREDIVTKLAGHIEKYGAEIQLAPSGGALESWPPVIKKPSDSVPFVGIPSTEVETFGSHSSNTFEGEAIAGTSLDEEIRNTMKLANELLGLSEETRSLVTNVDETKVDGKEKSSGPS